VKSFKRFCKKFGTAGLKRHKAEFLAKVSKLFISFIFGMQRCVKKIAPSQLSQKMMEDERGDVPGWVLVVLMTTGLVTAIWTIAAPRLTAILRNSLDSMNGIR